jgi:hydrogenase nickel incorporation protein HypB
MTERIAVVEKIMGANERLADQNRRRLDDSAVIAINLMASPGAGKTSLIEHTVTALRQAYAIAVIDGDVATGIDAARAAEAGARAVQINTGGECHLDAVMLQEGLDQLDLMSVDLLVIENVGNLICPAGFPLGAHKNILIASIPEGADKPYKYPSMYKGVDALVINKIDLRPYVEFDMDYFQRGVETLNPGLLSFPVSCKTGEGLAAWQAWLETLLS